MALVCTMLLNGLRRFWYVCSAGILFLFLLYLLNGGTIVIVLLIFALAGMLYNAGDSLLFYPESPPHARIFVESPSAYSLPFENLFVRAVDGPGAPKLNLVFIKQHDIILPMAPTVVYFHGNAGNVGHRLPNVDALYKQLGCNILLVEYRGYGKSEGKPGEVGFYDDARTAIEYLLRRNDIDKRQIIVFGRSLGGAMAVFLASDPRYGSMIRCCVVENTFTNIPDIAKVIFSFRIVQMLPKFLFKNQFPNDERVKKIEIPVLFLSGLQDALIPSWMMRSLHDMCSSSLKRLVTFDHGGHNDTWQSRGYYGAWSHFQKEVTAFHANRETSEHDAEGENNSSDLKASDSFTLLIPQPPEHIFEPQ